MISHSPFRQLNKALNVQTNQCMKIIYNLNNTQLPLHLNYVVLSNVVLHQ